MRKVKLNDIRIDGGTQCRVEIDQALIYHYVEKMKEGDDFPMIEAVYDGATYWLTDGFHRYHVYKLMGLKIIEIKYKPGTQQDAILAALKANTKHGKNLSIADKENKVRMALAIEGYNKLKNSEIARICELSESFVAGVRDPAKKEKQKQNMANHWQKKAEKLNSDEQQNPSLTRPDSEQNTTPRENTNKNTGAEPSEEELKANEKAMQADFDMFNKLLESSEPLATAHDEIKRLNLRVAQLETRLNSLMTEKNEAIKDAKRAQAQLDKIQKAKK